MIKVAYIIICSLGILGCSPSPEKVDVLEINKSVFSGAPTDPLAPACRAWELNSESINKVLMLSDDLSGEELHKHFYQLPCEITGKVEIKGELLNFSLNAASFIKLYNSDSITYKGCSSQECKQFFLIEPEK